MQNSYFPATYNQPYYPYQQPSYQPQTTSYQPQSNSGITWVDGISSARAYPVVNGTSILLMDSNESAFYIKSADQSGMPSLRIFDYSERIQSNPNSQPQIAQVQPSQSPVESAPKQEEIHEDKIDMSIYVTKEELQEAKKNIEDKIDSLSSSISSSSSQKNGTKK